MATIDKRLFEVDPRDYALTLVEEHGIDADSLLLACLKCMTHAEVRVMLDMNELSPRFMSSDECVCDVCGDTVDTGWCADGVCGDCHEDIALQAREDAHDECDAYFVPDYHD